jgi:hypothetical protein
MLCECGGGQEGELTRHLVLNVDSSSTLLNEELGELHDGGESSVSGVGIGDVGAEVVDVGGGSTLGGGEVGASLTLLSVVEELGHEEVLDLEGNGVVGVV